MLIRALAVIAMGSLVAGCDGKTIVDGEAVTVIVYGRVTTTSGAPVPAFMSLSARAHGSCENPPIAAVNAVTNASGQYRAVLVNWGTQFTVCVSVHAAPQQGSGLVAASAQLAPVEMRSGLPDSVRVDLELQPGG